MEKKTKKIIVVVAVVVVIAVVAGIAAWYNAPTQKVQRLLDLGQQYLLAEDYEQAETYFYAVIAIEPKTVDAYMYLSDLYIERGDGYEAALSILQEGYNNTLDEGLKIRIDEITALNNSANISEDTEESNISNYVNVLIPQEEINILLEEMDQISNIIIFEHKLKDYTSPQIAADIIREVGEKDAYDGTDGEYYYVGKWYGSTIPDPIIRFSKYEENYSVHFYIDENYASLECFDNPVPEFYPLGVSLDDFLSQMGDQTILDNYKENMISVSQDGMNLYIYDKSVSLKYASGGEIDLSISNGVIYSISYRHN